MKDKIVQVVRAMASIPFFPADEYAQEAIMNEISKFADREDRLLWLFKATISTMRRWGGLSELRGLYCTRFKPADGIEADCHLPGYSANDCEARHALEVGMRLALPVAPVADKGLTEKLDCTTADLRQRQKEERFALIAKVEPKSIHIPATRKRTPEEHAAAVRELEEQLSGATVGSSRKAG